MLRKTLIAGVVVIILIILALPLVFSFKLGKYESLYTSKMASNDWVQIKHMYLSRGWFSTRSRITLAPADAVCTRDCPKLQINSTIYHGPLPFGAFSKADIPPQFAQGVILSKVQLRFPEGSGIHPPLPPLRITTVIQLDGSQDLTMHAPFYSHHITTSNDNYALKTGPIRGEASLSRDGRLQRLHVEAKGFSLKSLPEKVLIAFARHEELQLQRDNSGKMHLSQKLQRLRLNEADGVTFSLQNLNWQSTSSRDAGLTSGKLKFHLGHLYTPARKWGPVNLNLTARRINIRALQRMNAGLIKLTSKTMSPAMKLLGALSVYQNTASAFLRPGPEMDIGKFTVGTSKGRFRSGGHIKFLPLSNGQSAGLPGLLDHVAANGVIWIPKPLMRALMRRRLALEGYSSPPRDQVEQSIHNLAEKKAIKPVDKINGWGTHVRLKNGKLTLNGKSVSAWKDLRSLAEDLLHGTPLSSEDKDQPAEKPSEP